MRPIADTVRRLCRFQFDFFINFFIYSLSIVDLKQSNEKCKVKQIILIIIKI